MKYNIGCFLNISLDHISDIEHKDFEDYFSSKLGFLELCDKVIIYRHTDYYERVLETVKDKEVITFGFKDSDYIIKDIINNKNLSFILSDGKKEEIYEINMPGRFNIINATCAIIIAKELNIDYENILKGLLETEVSGRMNLIKAKAPIIIDYAHNMLSAEALYKSLKEDYPNKKIKVLFGCPGNKGINRREEMGTLAGKYADYIYLTAEDPGDFTVEEISDEIAKYIEKYHNNYEIIEDRETAIKKAINELTKNDVLALLGKGDETYQIVKNEYIPYDTDKVIVERELSKIKES